ncbi:hypothetical protein CTAYLR_008982 [Chrysophaeum taylorii]|uniref:Ammonium transporter n=1 Tax=Chrysophaeum taylorii TaxID=2483200 RepID=A0AAD7UA16_9STRA|nr:hypothetical protein CTAYLR_008982 [Chrysophaeum taylorii]
MSLTDEDIEQVREALLGDESELRVELDSITEGADTMWLLFCAVLVFMMQAGFAALCAGSVRVKNVKNIMLKNMLDACMGALGFWSLGYGVAYGKYRDGNEIIGSSMFFLTGQFERKDNFQSFFFQFAFAATAATIVSGAVAERCGMFAYGGYAFVLTAFVYPVVVHWIWSDKGFLSAFKKEPYMNVGTVDFAGSGVVHMVGGIAAGLGAWVLGPRIGRFDEGSDPREFNGHSTPLTVLGTFLLWVGWYGFNPGSTLAIVGSSEVAAKAAVTTTLSAAAGGVTNLVLHFQITKRFSDDDHGVFDVAETCNGILAGLVAITSGCAVVEPWAACVVGLVGALVYSAFSKFLKKMHVDDAVNATPVHFAAGAWGLVAPGLFARGLNMRRAGYGHRTGLFYGGNGTMLAVQLLAMVAITLWVTCTMLPFFTFMNRVGIFRVSKDDEIAGLDDSKHGGSAYANSNVFGGKAAATGAANLQSGGEVVKLVPDDSKADAFGADSV